MLISQRFANNYLRAEDVTIPLTVTIHDVDEVTLGDDDRIVLMFNETEKVLPLNKTNAMALSDAFGDETDEWPGKVIELYRDKTMFNGKRVAALRVRAPKEQPLPQPQPKPRKARATDEPEF